MAKVLKNLLVDACYKLYRLIVYSIETALRVFSYVVSVVAIHWTTLKPKMLLKL